MPILALLPLIWTYIKNNKWIQYLLLGIAVISLISALLLHEIHRIRHTQEIKDQLKQEQLYNKALEDQVNRDKEIIDNFNKQIEIDKEKENALSQSTKSIIENNPNWANTPLPNGLEGVGQ